MMHIVAGYPNLVDSELIAQKILASGADILEVQIPFSDPVADGPVIASANEAALLDGATVRKSLDMIQRIAESTDKPILIMTYFNVINHYGVEAFCKKALAIGVQGLIVPDYPYDEDEGNSLLKHSGNNHLALIQVIASTTRDNRMKAIAEKASGFVYCMAHTGTTGSKTTIDKNTTDYLVNVRKHTSIPMAVGFGLSDRSQVEALNSYADIMVVGSALIKAYTDKPLEEGLDSVRQFMESLLSY